MKRRVQNLLAWLLLAVLPGCGSDDPAGGESSQTDHHTSSLIEGKPEGASGKANSTPPPQQLSEDEGREALGRILNTLDKARERAGIDEDDNDTTAEFGKIRYAGGAEYMGQFKEGKRHGYGAFTFPNGDRYQGQYDNGKRHGYGIYVFASGDRYEGYFHNGQYHHWGLYVFKNGDKYFGQYRLGKRNGKGTLSKKSGERYEGQFVAGKRHGQGACFFAGGGSYAGTWKNDEPDGWGTYLLASSQRFVPASSRHVQAETNQAQHDAETALAPPDGPETFAETPGLQAPVAGSPSADTGEGVSTAGPPIEAPHLTTDEPTDDARDGFLDFDNGDRYAGQLLAGQPHGQGAYLFDNGERYLGDFRKGAYHGNGLFTFADGSRYIGEWRDGLFHGLGILYGINGEIEREGIWSTGEPSE